MKRADIVDGDGRAALRSVPIGVCPYGCSPYSSRTNARSATAPGMSRSCVSRCSRSWRTRVEVGFPQRRPHDDVAEQRQRAVGEPAEHREAEERGVGADVGFELGAEARQRLVHLDRR